MFEIGSATAFVLASVLGAALGYWIGYMVGVIVERGRPDPPEKGTNDDS